MARPGASNPNFRGGGTYYPDGKGGRVVKTPTYQSWAAMNDRCYNSNHHKFSEYGGRGIQVCDRWRRGRDNKKGFLNFLTDMGERPSKAQTLDRIDPNDDYKPFKPDGTRQCQWADAKTQRRNQRRCMPEPVEEPLDPAIERSIQEIPYD